LRACPCWNCSSVSVLALVFFMSYGSNVVFIMFMFHFSTLPEKLIILKSYVYLLECQFWGNYCVIL
jgi:hypothetical protein